MLSKSTLVTAVGVALLIATVAVGVSVAFAQPARRDDGEYLLRLSVHHRKATTTGKFTTKHLDIDVPRANGDAIGIALPPVEFTLGDVRVHVGKGYNSMNVGFLDAKTDRVITSKLLQLDGNLRNQLDGLTGLSYVYHPTSESETQFTIKLRKKGEPVPPEPRDTTNDPGRDPAVE